MKYYRIIAVFFLFLSLSLYSQRSVQSLNAAWEFTSEVDGKVKIVNIPHTWNAEDPFRDGKEYFRGKGTYQKTMFAPEAWEQKRVFLKFKGSN